MHATERNHSGIIQLLRSACFSKDAYGREPGGAARAIGKVAGVASVHDLHVWSLTSGINAMSVHTVLADHRLHDEVLAAVQKKVTTDFKIAHATVQVECQGCADYETHL